MAAEHNHRTLICSIVFLDIIGYSKQPVTHQMALKDAFNNHISEAIKQVAESERVILDTGDGASICFMGDPEEALFAAISLRDAFSHDCAGALPDLLVRIGVNLGPIKQVQDINGQRNILGDGINVAQRIMSFAEPNQILVSRSYFEVVSCMSHEYSMLFQYLGARADKHVREHVVYEVRVPGAATAKVANEQPFLPPSELICSSFESVSSGCKEIQPPPVAQPAVDSAKASFSAETIERVRVDLARFVGPLAAFLVKQAAAKATDTSSMYVLLGQHIDDSTERANFLRAAPTQSAGTAAPADPAQISQPVAVPASALQFACLEKELG